MTLRAFGLLSGVKLEGLRLQSARKMAEYAEALEQSKDRSDRGVEAAALAGKRNSALQLATLHRRGISRRVVERAWRKWDTQRTAHDEVCFDNAFMKLGVGAA